MIRPLLTVVIPTIGRPTLSRTLESIERQRLDVEVLVVADTHGPLQSDVRAVAKQCCGATYLELDAGHHDWGSPQLQLGYQMAEGAWILNLGDDDVYEPYAFRAILDAIDSQDAVMPLMFRTVLHPAPQRGNTVPVVLWQDPELRRHNITGQSFVTPNDQERLGPWLPLADFSFITSTVDLWSGRVEWRTEIISQCY